MRTPVENIYVCGYPLFFVSFSFCALCHCCPLILLIISYKKSNLICTSVLLNFTIIAGTDKSFFQLNPDPWGSPSNIIIWLPIDPFPWNFNRFIMEWSLRGMVLMKNIWQNFLNVLRLIFPPFCLKAFCLHCSFH